ncbi:hypothetical protein PybrP1_007074, partial [[Pythium] brassicae (nom. inval.)]
MAKDGVEYTQVLTPRADEDGPIKSFTRKETGREEATKVSLDSSDGKHNATEKDAPASIPISQLYRFATPFDIASVVFGCLMAGANGALFPCMALEEKAQEEAQAAAADLANAREATTGAAEMVRRSSAHSIRSDRTVEHEDGDTSVTSASAPRFTIRDAMALSLPELRFLLVGMVGAGISGFALPVAAILMTEMITTMTSKHSNYEASGNR